MGTPLGLELPTTDPNARSAGPGWAQLLLGAFAAVENGSFVNPRARGADATGASLATTQIHDCVADLVPGSVLAFIGGTYLVDDTVWFDNLVDVTVLFFGATLKLAGAVLGGSSEKPLIAATNCERLHVWHPRINGNRAGQSGYSEFNHGILIGAHPGGGVASGPCTETYIDDPRIWNTAGDCIDITGGSVDTWVDKGRLADPNSGGVDNPRQGLAITNASGVYADGTVFQATGSTLVPGRMAVDIEPSVSADAVDRIHLTNLRQYGADWNRFVNLTGAGGPGNYGEFFIRGCRSAAWLNIDPPNEAQLLVIEDNDTDQNYYIANVNRVKWRNNSAGGNDADGLVGALAKFHNAPKVAGSCIGGELVNKTGAAVAAGLLVEGSAKHFKVDPAVIGGAAPGNVTKGIVIQASGGIDPTDVKILGGTEFYSNGGSMSYAIDAAGLSGSTELRNAVGDLPALVSMQGVNALLNGGAKLSRFTG